MTIVYRGVKGTKLTIAEGDGNISDLDGRVTALAAAVAALGTTTTTTTITVSGSAPGGTSGTAYTSTTFTATGGTSPYTYSSSGTLPTGLTINSSTGVLSGTPSAAGTFSFLVHAIDSTSASGNSALQTVVIASATVTVSVPVNSAVPTISGTAQVGATLTASHGTWSNSPTGYTGQWYGNGTAISGATTMTYVPVTGDIGHTITYGEIASNTGGAGTAATSTATSAVIAATVTPAALIFTSLGGNVVQTADGSTGFDNITAAGGSTLNTNMSHNTGNKLASGVAGWIGATQYVPTSGGHGALIQLYSGNSTSNAGNGYTLQCFQQTDGTALFSVAVNGTFMVGMDGQGGNTGDATGAAGCGFRIRTANSGADVYFEQSPDPTFATGVVVLYHATGQTASDLYPWMSIHNQGGLKHVRGVGFA